MSRDRKTDKAARTAIEAIMEHAYSTPIHIESRGAVVLGSAFFL